ncbi:hypothetical protein BVRB_3g064970 [Beta vulgaris subsp. vulgaris]|nr:hypothetical protein BVRB_3g064970 [Beta vulgaris subsp. vulgaris]
MSAVVGTICSSQNPGIILSSNINKEVEHKADDNIESISCELKAENADIICKDLIKEMSKRTNHSEDNCVVKQDDDACLKSEDSAKDKPLDKDDEGDESSSNQKQQLLESNDLLDIGDKNSTPEVQILSLSVLSPGRTDVVLTIPFLPTTSKATLFTLKEGSKYRIKFLFTVTKKAVKNLTYTYMVWKSGIRVHQTKKLIGTFSPRQEQYTFELEEGTTPSGFFARGPFLVRSKFVDDDGNCYLDTTYYFDIRKDWGAREKC